MFCPNCGTELSENARFCPGCGAPVAAPAETALPIPRRPLWPWLIAVVLLAVAVGVLLFLLFLRPGTPAPQPAPSAAPTVTASPQEILIPSPTPTTEIIVVTTAPASPSPSPAPSASPAPEVPTAVKVFYHTTELSEFTAAVNESVNLSAQAYPIEHFTNSSFSWSCSESGVLKIEPDSYGRTCTVTVLKKHSGPVTLTVSCSGAKAEVKVYTKDAAPTTVPSGSVKLEGDLLYRINVFLSNFSEQQIKTFNASTVADDYLLRFVELYCKINHHELIFYENSEECLSLDNMNLYYERFFGRKVNPVNGATYLLDAWNEFRYSGGAFRFPAADGAPFNRFTVVYDMVSNGDGTYTVQFQNFELDITEYWDHGMDSTLYHKSNDDMASLVFSGRVKPVEGGTAKVRDYTFNGRPTYQILSYEVWNITF